MCVRTKSCEYSVAPTKMRLIEAINTDLVGITPVSPIVLEVTNLTRDLLTSYSTEMLAKKVLLVNWYSHIAYGYKIIYCEDK